MVNLANIITDKETPASALKVILTQLFKDSWVTWEIETVVQEIQRLYNVTISRTNLDKIHALRAIANSADFQLSAAVFENIVTAINGHVFDPDELQICSPEEITYAVIVSGVPPEDFGREVRGYINVCMKSAGLLRFPRALHGLETGDPALIAKISPSPAAPTGDELDDVIKVQSHKLYQVEVAVHERLHRFADKLVPKK